MHYIYCHPLFDERKCAHRFSYYLTGALADAGLELCRFDYIGTGDDEGEFADVTLDSLRNDLARIIPANVDICMIGLRLGASLALDYTISKPFKVKKLVLLEPIIKGDEYIDYLLRKQRIKDMMTNNSKSTNENNGSYNIEGFQASTKFINQLKGFDLFEITQKSHSISDTLIVQINTRTTVEPQLAKLTKCLGNNNSNIQLESVSLPGFWERIVVDDYSPLTKLVTCYCHE